MVGKVTIGAWAFVVTLLVSVVWAQDCRDNKRGPRIDSGCNDTNRFCDSGDGTNDADSAAGTVCRLCSGRGPLKKFDWNCPPEAPSCITSEGVHALWKELGDECACLLECPAGEVVDTATCTCVVAEGTCTDNKKGPRIDSGCNGTLRFCDGGDGRNDGDSSAGDVCRLCAGRGPRKNIDWNCPRNAPSCVTSDGVRALWKQLGDECVCLIDCPSGEVVDTATCSCVPGCSDPPTCNAPLELNSETCECECADAPTCTSAQELNAETCECECVDPPTCSAAQVSLNPATCECECTLVQADCDDNTIVDLDLCECVPDDGCDVECAEPLILAEDLCECICPLDAQIVCDSPQVFSEETCQCEGDLPCDRDPSECVAPEFLNTATCECGPCAVTCTDPAVLVEDTCSCLCPIEAQLDCLPPLVLNETTCECGCPNSGECPGDSIFIDALCECLCPVSVEGGCNEPFTFFEDECTCACDVAGLNCVRDEVLNSETCMCECPLTADDCADTSLLDAGICACGCNLTDDDCFIDNTVDEETCQCTCEVSPDSCADDEFFIEEACRCVVPQIPPEETEMETETEAATVPMRMEIPYANLPMPSAAPKATI